MPFLSGSPSPHHQWSRNHIRFKNSVLHVATDYVKMTSIDHLPEKTKVLPVHDHLSFLCSQYLARTLQSSNSSQNVITSPSGFRNMKHTLQSRFLHCTPTYLWSDIPPTASSKTAIKSLHNVSFPITISSIAPSPVLQTSSPHTSTEEVNLPIKTSLRSKPPYRPKSSYQPKLWEPTSQGTPHFQTEVQGVPVLSSL